MDELAHTNVPGSPRAKRWEDVEVLFNAGHDVVATVNIQHIESLNDKIAQLTGVRVRETIPDPVFAQADDVLVIDATPEFLQARLRRGEIYPPERVEQALQNFFRSSNLSALRELALIQVAEEADKDLTAYRREAQIAYARAKQVTQIFLGRSGQSRWAELLQGSVINEVVRRAEGIDVHIVADR